MMGTEHRKLFEKFKLVTCKYTDWFPRKLKVSEYCENQACAAASPLASVVFSSLALKWRRFSTQMVIGFT